MSGWLVINVAVLPIPLLMAYIINQPLEPLIFSLYNPPEMLAFVLTMQKMNSPQTAGRIMMLLNQKNARSWYGLKAQNGKCTSQNRKKASIPAVVMPTDSGMWLGMSV